MNATPRRLLGLAQLSLLDTAPPDLVAIAAEAGFDFIGARVRPVTPAERPFDLQPGSPMLRETLARMRDSGVTVRDIEFLLLDGSEQREAWLRMMESGQALGARTLTVAAADPDRSRLAGNLARMAEDGRGFGITPTLEPISYQAIASMADAAAFARQAGMRSQLVPLPGRFGTVVPVEVQGVHHNLAAGLVPLLQLCDGPARRPASREDLIVESRSERGVPGEGDFDLAALVAALPADLPVSVETPSDRSVAELGESGWARRLKAGADAVLAEAGAQNAGNPVSLDNLEKAGHR
jgi:sugar phosphate isomerase/epimerase